MRMLLVHAIHAEIAIRLGLFKKNAQINYRNIKTKSNVVYFFAVFQARPTTYYV